MMPCSHSKESAERLRLANGQYFGHRRTTHNSNSSPAKKRCEGLICVAICYCGAVAVAVAGYCCFALIIHNGLQFNLTSEKFAISDSFARSPSLHRRFVHLLVRSKKKSFFSFREK